MWCPDPVPVVPETIVRQPKVGRNEPCPCDSGVKFKRCCQLRLPCGGVRRGDMILPSGWRTVVERSNV
jgi:hypothetical protein